VVSKNEVDCKGGRKPFDRIKGCVEERTPRRDETQTQTKRNTNLDRFCDEGLFEEMPRLDRDHGQLRGNAADGAKHIFVRRHCAGFFLTPSKGSARVDTVLRNQRSGKRLLAMRPIASSGRYVTGSRTGYY
jgi:hypothetical protein